MSIPKYCLEWFLSDKSCLNFYASYDSQVEIIIADVLTQVYWDFSKNWNAWYPGRIAQLFSTEDLIYNDTRLHVLFPALPENVIWNSSTYVHIRGICSFKVLLWNSSSGTIDRISSVRLVSTFSARKHKDLARKRSELGYSPCLLGPSVRNITQGNRYFFFVLFMSPHVWLGPNYILWGR